MLYVIGLKVVFPLITEEDVDFFPQLLSVLKTSASKKLWLRYKNRIGKKIVSEISEFFLYIHMFDPLVAVVYIFPNGWQSEMLKKNPSSYILQPDPFALPLEQYSDTGHAFKTHLKNNPRAHDRIHSPSFDSICLFCHLG